MFYGLSEETASKLNAAVNLLKEVYGDRIYLNDMLISIWKNLSFRADENFMQAYNSSITNEQERSLFWRLHTLAWAAQNALQVEGDFVECGVLKGFCSEVIFKYTQFEKQSKQAFLYDTFSTTLPEETSSQYERENWQYRVDGESDAYTQVCQKFALYKNVHIVRGIIPYSFKQKVPKKIAFLHIDLNSAKAEMLALEHLFDRVSVGGYIVFDDFGWDINANQTNAELAFLKERNHRILELPTGQGLVIKQPQQNKIWASIKKLFSAKN